MKGVGLELSQPQAGKLKAKKGNQIIFYFDFSKPGSPSPKTVAPSSWLSPNRPFFAGKKSDHHRIHVLVKSKGVIFIISW